MLRLDGFLGVLEEVETPPGGLDEVAVQADEIGGDELAEILKDGVGLQARLLRRGGNDRARLPVGIVRAGRVDVPRHARLPKQGPPGVGSQPRLRVLLQLREDDRLHGLSDGSV
jgi:hypothetical protein